MKSLTQFVFGLLLLSAAGSSALPGGNAYRKDGGDESLPWYQIKPGEFPPADAAHHDNATLTWNNPYLRTGEYRPDSRVTDHLTRMTPFSMLPCATIMFHGAPADLGDLPPGIHVHMELFQNAERNAFTQVLSLADDFSASVAAGETYRVEKLLLSDGKIVLRRQKGALDTDAKTAPKEYMVDARTRLWMGRGFAEEKDLAVGQTVLVNLAVGTARLPVIQRCTDIWLDEESRGLAMQQQRASHLVELRRRGLPAYIEAVDNHNPTVTIVLFASGYPELFTKLKVGSAVRLAVADETLRTVEPAGGQGGGDAIDSEIAEVTSTPAVSGSSGIRLVLKPKILLEGFRPNHVVRIAPPGFAVLPAEEHLEF